jgi:hypothetical protein
MMTSTEPRRSIAARTAAAGFEPLASSIANPMRAAIA